MHNQNKLNFFIWTVPFLNSTGRSIYDLAFIWMILEMTGSEKITGLVAMTSYVPAILFGRQFPMAQNRSAAYDVERSGGVETR